MLSDYLTTDKFWGIIISIGAVCIIFGAFDILNEEFGKKSLKKIAGGLLIIGLGIVLKQFGV